mmetsp:Transcript_20249/g.61680  ORF Transcript_20249/g.61680 Transcript_20249/m.61680 type:complete len:202 (+) Transcript_20249:270-875(+)
MRSRTSGCRQRWRSCARSPRSTIQIWSDFLTLSRRPLISIWSLSCSAEAHSSTMSPLSAARHCPRKRHAGCSETSPRALLPFTRWASCTEISSSRTSCLMRATLPRFAILDLQSEPRPPTSPTLRRPASSRRAARQALSPLRSWGTKATTTLPTCGPSASSLSSSSRAGLRLIRRRRPTALGSLLQNLLRRKRPSRRQPVL